MIKIDQNLCNACGICSQVCPRHIPEMIDKDNEKIMKISKKTSRILLLVSLLKSVLVKSHLIP